MTGLKQLITRNCKLFFKDKGLFFTSLITPMILLVLYASFLANVFRDTFLQVIGDTISVSEDIIDGLVGSQIISSLLAVSCVTVAFCSNMLMVQDKISGARRDLTMTPVKSSTLAVGYFAATLSSTMIVCLVATGACFVYIAATGWYMSFTDVLLILSDVVLLTVFGTALSSLINAFLSTQGQISAVGTIVSSGYGFICGAYMPISQFSEGLQNFIAFLPGTYGTALLRTHCMRGPLAELESLGFPEEALKDFRDSLDCNIYFFDNLVPLPVMYAILLGAVALVMCGYVLAIGRRKAK